MAGRGYVRLYSWGNNLKRKACTSSLNMGSTPVRYTLMRCTPVRYMPMRCTPWGIRL
jgi:hypothetical protein